MAMPRFLGVPLKTISRVTAVIGLAIFLFSVSGCSKPAPVTTLSYRMAKNHENGAAWKIGGLTIVFVGLDCEGGTAGQILVSESHSATYYTFTIEDGGKKLIYKENSYTLGDSPRTIVIAEEGTATLKEEREGVLGSPITATGSTPGSSDFCED